MKSFTDAWARGVIKYRAVTLIISLILVVLSPFSFHRLYHDDSNESYFLEHDPNLNAFNHLLEEFGDSEYLLIGIPARAKDKDVFNPELIAMVANLTEFLQQHRHVTQVRSLSKYQYTHDDNGILATDDLFEDPADMQVTEGELEQARTVMRGQDMALGSLLTTDLKHTLIAARTVYRRGENNHKVEVVHEVMDFITKQGYREQGFDLHLSGIPVVSERFQTLTQKDTAVINPIMSVVILAILFAVFRSAVATLLPLLLIGSVVLITTGLQGWLRWPITAVNTALIPTIIILAVGTAIHVLVEFYHFRRMGFAQKDAAVATTRDLLFPVFFTCLTTAIGFFTLSITELSPVRQFALLASSSSMIIFIVSLTTLPALLSYIPWIAKGNPPTANQDSNLMTRLLKGIPSFTQKKRYSITVIGLVVSLFSIYSINFIQVDTNIVNYFKKSSWMNQDLNYFNETFKGISNLEVIVDSGREDGIKNPAFLARVESLQTYLEQQPETGKATSLIRFYKQINKALHEDQPKYYVLPDTQALAGQLLFLYENTSPDEDLSDLKNFQNQLLRISIPVLNMNAKEMTATLKRIQTHINAEYSDLQLELTGGLVMNNAQNNYVNNGMFSSFGSAILAIGICFLLLFRSLKYGLIALIPSIVPILLTGGLISLAGVAMDLGTMIVGAMTIGIAVDDSIHLMSRYLKRRTMGDSVFTAMQSALATSGKAVILTSIILVTGFSVMLIGSFVSFIYVGLFSAMIMSFALIGDLIFMPALLFLFDRSIRHDEKSIQSSRENAALELKEETHHA